MHVPVVGLHAYISMLSFRTKDELRLNIPFLIARFLAQTLKYRLNLTPQLKVKWIKITYHSLPTKLKLQPKIA
ncbi:hypothetical protein DPMN_030733 [Dreissena polymorpha]|uniref:Uncharacterized protein n=1 Tax=Dreissena polymorpha TaxID=45954 RepID=A0A9D4RGF6_DREPO|nr:hypothetical protein DPMN_030733 [Dreissena polymorpha]